MEAHLRAALPEMEVLSLQMQITAEMLLLVDFRDFSVKKPKSL
jgi:hypothetical protein